jgi:Fe2+ or Zn2+ uptake regulation protein
MEDRFAKLTNAVYRVLEFFPESDLLKNRVKEKALAIIENSKHSQLSEDIDALLNYLWIGKCQGWLSNINYLIICNEYEKIRKELLVKDEKGLESTTPGPAVIVFSPRQLKIIEFLEKNEKAQVMDLQAILPDVTKRTIRRDLEELLEAGRIARFGDFNQVFYRINR